jgi:hypothetical protein
MKRVMLVFSIATLILAFGMAPWRSAPVAASAETATGHVGTNRPLFPWADSLHIVSEQCLQDGQVLVHFDWVTYNFGQQWVDLSVHNNGWQSGTFIGLGPLGPQQTSYEWSGLIPGQWHYLRINTLTAFGWQPSETYPFFSRSDCGIQYFDGDGDGVANQFDSCPTQFGLPQFSGCPAPYVPLAHMCENPNGTGWCPGQPAPAQHCGFSAQAVSTFGIVSPQVITTEACVWQPRGEGAFYYPSEVVTICYLPSHPMQLHVMTHMALGDTNLIASVFDDGHGNCTRTDILGRPLQVGQTRGLRTIYLYSNNQLLDTHTFYVP